MGKIRKTVGVIMYLAPFVAIFVVCSKAFGVKTVLLFTGAMVVAFVWFFVAACILGVET